MQELHERISDLIDQSEYQKAAELFLSETGIKMSVKFKKYGSMSWDDNGQQRNIFKVKLKKEDGSKYATDYGDSVMNSQKSPIKTPSAYDVLSCLSVSYFTDADEVIDNFGTMKIRQAIAIFKADKKMRAFFSEEEIQALNAIN